MVMGWILFGLISGFCFVLIIGFCEVEQVGQSEKQREWLVSSCFSVLIDFGLFEMIPAVVVGCLGVASLRCRGKCLVKAMLVIEGYRGIRSFVGV